MILLVEINFHLLARPEKPRRVSIHFFSVCAFRADDEIAPDPPLHLVGNKLKHPEINALQSYHSRDILLLRGRGSGRFMALHAECVLCITGFEFNLLSMNTRITPAASGINSEIPIWNVPRESQAEKKWP